VYIFLVHLTALYHFARGFLLTRVTSLQRTPTYDLDTIHRPLPATHEKAIIVIIDALRSDFIHAIPTGSPVYNDYYHNQLTLPAELTAQNPQNSILFELFSDPPTTTMQRLKGLTTGSLPTFIDAGSNFASTEVLEDNLISQWNSAGKQVGVLGDDTWLGLFPLSSPDKANASTTVKEKYWKPDLTHGFDSFNVEDLHSVDEGVISNFFPILANENRTSANDWDVLILHFLGVDHVGHRVGPSSATMSRKLLQMNEFLRDTVAQMHDDTLLILLGDHGMDEKGDHGGDGHSETSAAGWVYSKTKPISTSSVKDNGDGNYEFGHLMSDPRLPRTRKANQIDLVPTLSLLLGTSIPYNNLGSVIPDFFLGDETLETLYQAMHVNADQIAIYLENYPGSTLSAYQHLLDEAWENVISTRMDTEEILSRMPMEGYGDVDLQDDLREARARTIEAERDYISLSLNTLRGLWAQFSMRSMALGLSIFGLSLPAIWALYLGIRNTREAWDVYAREALVIAITVGSTFGSVVGTGRGIWTRVPSEALAWTWSAGVLGSLVAILATGTPAMAQMASTFFFRPKLMQMVAPMMLLLYSIAFAANSFIIWEDRMSTFLLTSVLLVPVVKAMTAPTHRLRLRILGFSLAAAVLVRFISISTVCREEQGGYCHMTFYAGATSPMAPSVILAAILPMGWYLPKILGLVLGESKSNSGPAPLFLFGSQIELALGAVYWIFEYAEHWEGLNHDRIQLVKIAKVWIARAAFGLILGASGAVWAGMPLCIEVKREEQAASLISQAEQDNGVEATSNTPQVVVLGFANAFGSSYLLFLMLGFALLFLVSLPTGQVIIALGLLALLCHIEASDAMRDAQAMTTAFAESGSPEQFDESTLLVSQNSPPKFRETGAMVLLGHVLFFVTGHQASFTNIQWKSAFVGVYSVVYPVSPLLVVLNTYAGYILLALSVPLLSLWNVSPAPRGRIPVIADTLQAMLAVILQYTSITLTSAFFAAWLRRHLMVWKVFAPRFMLAGTTLLVVEITLILAMGLGVRGVTSKVAKTFKTESI
jgi:phosphatidylinositol glycan class O